MAKSIEKADAKSAPASSPVSSSSSSSSSATATVAPPKPVATPPVASPKPMASAPVAPSKPAAAVSQKAAAPFAKPPQNGLAVQPHDPARDSALTRAVQQIEKQFGKGSVMKLDGENIKPIDGIATGSLSLDIALGGSGIPKGRVIEIFGPESSGKTTLTLHIIASSQKAGGVAAFIDAEHALDPSWAKRLGVQLNDLLVSQPDTGEQALEICELLVRSNAVDVVVIDSVAALIPRAEIEGEMGDSHMGLQARLMSQALRKLTGAISKSKTTVIFINQIREKIGVMFGNPETTTGGRALKFYASIRIDVRRTQTIKDGEVSIGARTAPALSKTRSRRRSGMLSLTSCSIVGSVMKGICLTWRYSATSLIRAAPGLTTRRRVWVRDVKTPNNSCPITRIWPMKFGRRCWKSRDWSRESRVRTFLWTRLSRMPDFRRQQIHRSVLPDA